MGSIRGRDLKKKGIVEILCSDSLRFKNYWSLQGKEKAENGCCIDTVRKITSTLHRYHK